MGHHAIQAIVGGAGGGHNHFTIALGQVAGPAHRLGQHEGIVVRKKCTPLSWSAGKSQKNLRHKACFFLDFQNFGPNVLG